MKTLDKSRNCPLCVMLLLRMVNILVNIPSVLLVNTHVPLKIRPFKFPETVEAGKSVQIVCGLDEGDGYTEFRWLKDGLPIVSGTDWSVITQPKFSLLEVKNVKVTSSGNYTCIVKNAYEMDSYAAILSVQGPPTWKIEPTDVRATVGESFKIPCSVYGSPAPSVVWTKESWRDSGSLFQDLQDIVDEEGSLHFKQVQRISGGYYTCALKNGIENLLQKTIEIRVNGNIQIIIKAT